MGMVLLGEGGCEIDAVQAGVMEVADDAVPVTAEAQRVSVEIPDDGGPAHRDEALDHDGEDVLASYQAAVEESEAWGHQHDQAGAQNHETGITGIEVKHENLQEMKWGRGLAHRSNSNGTRWQCQRNECRKIGNREKICRPLVRQFPLHVRGQLTMERKRV